MFESIAWSMAPTAQNSKMLESLVQTNATMMQTAQQQNQAIMTLLASALGQHVHLAIFRPMGNTEFFPLLMVVALRQYVCVWYVG